MSEETIERLQRMADRAIHLPGEPPFVMSLDDGIALHEAIAALSAEPCEDAISRQDLQKLFRQKCVGECGCCGYERKNGCGLIDEMPSVTPKQPTEDWSRVRVKEYRQGQINILKIIEANIQSEIKRIREEMQGLKESEG